MPGWRSAAEIADPLLDRLPPDALALLVGLVRRHQGEMRGALERLPGEGHAMVHVIADEEMASD